MTSPPRDAEVSPMEFRIAGIGSIPEIIRASGDQAEAAYLVFIGRAEFRRGTRKVYATNARRFFDWALRRGFSLKSISACCIEDYITDVTATKSRTAAYIYLTPVRGIFRSLTISGVLTENPFECWYPNAHVSPCTIKECEDRFPLLSVMAMLANMEETSLQRIFDDTDIANRLLKFVRWRDCENCKHCGEVEAQTGDDSHEQAGHQCRACGRAYSVTDGSPFEGSSIPLNQAVFLLWMIYLQVDSVPDIAAIARDRGIDVESAVDLAFRLSDALENYGLSAGRALVHLVHRRHREMMQDEAARDIMEYAQLEAARDTLIAARDAGATVTDLPAEMTFDEALTNVCARIAEHDRYVVEMVDGYLTSRLAEPDELE
jgi:hypothetical protein